MPKRKKSSLSCARDLRRKRKMKDKSAAICSKPDRSSLHQVSYNVINDAVEEALTAILAMVELNEDKSHRILPLLDNQARQVSASETWDQGQSTRRVFNTTTDVVENGTRPETDQADIAGTTETTISSDGRQINQVYTSSIIISSVHRRPGLSVAQEYQMKDLQNSAPNNSGGNTQMVNTGLETEVESEESDTETGVLPVCSQASTATLQGNACDDVEPIPTGLPTSAIPKCDVGGLTIQCRYCSAYHFHGELTRSSRPIGDVASFSSCCLDGKVVLTPKSGPPPLLRRLFYGQHLLSNEFKDHIRQYNNALAFTSMVANAMQFSGRGPYTFNVHGQVYHYSSCLEAQTTPESRFAQLYVLDSDMATDIRVEKYGSTLSRDLMDELASEISGVNPFARSYKMMKQVVEDDSRLFPGVNREIVMVFDIDRSRNSRTHNIPVSNEIAAVFVSPDGEVPSNRGIVVRHRDNRIRRMPIISPFVDPMTYPLLFPHGDRGWHPGLLMNVPGGSKRQRVTMRAYYSYLAHYRGGSILHMAGKLFQQFLVDVFCKVEENDLDFIRKNQKKLRVESYLGLMDHINNEAVQRGARVGRRIILPSSFNGGLRNKTQHYQDSMAMVCKFGKPDFFLTFTCNPQWPEITDNLLPGQKAHDRPDIVSRVFKLKLDELREDLVKKHVLGKILAHVGVIEFQKRGLPHAHLLLTLRPDHKLLTPEDIDAVVSAEIPSPIDDPEGHEAVMKHLIHGPCGQDNPNCPCTANG